MTTALLPSRGAPLGKRVRHLDDHSALYAPGASVPAAAERTRRDVPDAIVVPATRPASSLERHIDLAADLGTELVVLCSRRTSVEQVIERMRRRVGSRGVVASVDGCVTQVGTWTAGTRFLLANGGRTSDLSAKRNLALLLARSRGWRKIVFVDDDVWLRTADVPRIIRRLDQYPIVGMRLTDFPDNSVLCHARRLAKMPQSVFATGAVLGVDCEAPDLGFFPDVYNEDWFFFGEAAASRRLPKPLPAWQAPYDPYLRSDRARHEEFGDLLAEGLYSLAESSGVPSFDQVVGLAREPFWDDFIEERLGTIEIVHKRLTSFLVDDVSCGVDVGPALAALEAAREAYDTPGAAVTATTCMEYLDGWREDTAAWRSAFARTPVLARSEDALAQLGVIDPRAVHPGIS